MDRANFRPRKSTRRNSNTAAVINATSPEALSALFHEVMTLSDESMDTSTDDANNINDTQPIQEAPDDVILIPDTRRIQEAPDDVILIPDTRRIQEASDDVILIPDTRQIQEAPDDVILIPDTRRIQEAPDDVILIPDTRRIQEASDDVIIIPEAQLSRPIRRETSEVLVTPHTLQVSDGGVPISEELGSSPARPSSSPTGAIRRGRRRRRRRRTAELSVDEEVPQEVLAMVAAAWRMSVRLREIK
ncbi:uncharacterized protein [Embiotoca jacksoni]|uniref:uncharacterized protein n=1 Tax=Embiotoca jacksoni TaxID=100190 RepID=UPI0037043B5B